MRLSAALLSCALALSAFVAPIHAQEIKVANLEKVNTEADETDPFLTPDGLSLLYATNAKGTFDIYVAKRATSTGTFGAGALYYGEKDADERGPCFFNQYLYFSTNLVPDEKLKDAKNFDIYRKVDKVRPNPMPQVNSPEDEMRVFITPAGKELYFSRKTKEGWVLMSTTGPNAGGIKEPKEVGFPVGFHSASLAPNGLSMYLEGEHEGKAAIFRSKRERVGGSWSMPTLVKNLLHPETKRGDSAPFVASGGTRLIFASDRPGGKGGLDLWSVAIAELKE
ncbi:MAG: hypothetical protein U0744_21635 [Gemmataceae bacterium]